MGKIKNRSLIATIAVILIAGVGGYYLIKLKRGPYPAATFVSFQYKWGDGDTLANSYDSNTGNYQYLDHRDSLIHKKVKLNANNIIFLHSRVNEAGLWELPNIIGSAKDNKGNSAFRYEMIFNYEQQHKKIIYYPSANADVGLANSASKLIAAIEQTIKDAEDRHPDR
jgi:hypothetical protein